jgi:serine protease Do
MRRLILIQALILPVLTVFSYAAALSGGAHGEIFGFSSEDSGSSYLGVDTRDITEGRMSVLHLKEETGVEITMVDQDAPAGKAGLKEQDVILTLNGDKVESVEQLRRMIRETPPGRTVTLGIKRNGQPMTIKVQLGDRKDSFAGAFPKAKDFHFDMPEMPIVPDIDIPAMSIVVVHSSSRSGLMVENLTPQLGDFFGVKNGQGVLIRSVEKGSRADQAGFRAGDVITKINGETVHDAGDFTHALRARKENSASVSILRDKKELTITLSLPEHKQSEQMRESLEMPEIDAATRKEMSQLRSEMARLRPELEQAVNKEMEKAKSNLKLNSRELCEQREEIRKETQEMQREMHQRQLEIQRELREALRESEL